MNPLHFVDDPGKARALAADMENRGWVGSPLVVWSDYGQLLTGVHRYEAASEILGWSDSEIPTIDILDVFAEDSQDFSKILAKHGNPGPFANTWGAFVDMLDELSPTIREKYGLDIEA